MFTLDLSIVDLTMAMFGGYRSLDGMMIATLILGSASEYLRPFGQFRLVVYGGILLLTMMVAPRGILPALAMLRRRR
jgi:branched-chain amino acid transport system permease protein